MHILFLTDNFPPEVNAPASRTFEHCRAWVNAGHRVTVITGAPNFPKGKVFKGYRNRPWQQETLSGIRVLRVWTYIAANQGFARRTLDYLSYMVTGFLAGLFVRRVDVVVGTSPQFFTVCAAYAVSRIKRAPWVFELRDLWPESIRAVGAMKTSKALDLVERVELRLYRKAAKVISVTQAFRDNLIGRGIDGDKIHVVTNGVDINRFSPSDKDAELVDKLGLQDRFVAGYIGTHGMAHGLETLLEAAARLKTRPDGDRYRIMLLGDGARKGELVAQAQSMGLDNVIFADSVSKDEVVRYWSLLDVSIVHLRKMELFATVIPSKLFECMGMGIPVLHGVAGESAVIVEQAGAGIVFEPDNAAALCDGLIKLAEDRTLYQQCRHQGRMAAKQYDRSVLALKMLALLQSLSRH